MTDIRQQTADVLTGLARNLREARFGGPLGGLLDMLSGDLERLAGQAHERCVVAIVGQVKAGKSTFLNALLGDDLATVGTTETTATINFFRHGDSDPERPVRCHWRNGQITEEPRSFLEGLQGNDLEALRRADGIDHLEYLVPNSYLRHVTLVDTPGTGAVVDTHQNRTAEFVRLYSQLRDRHHAETERLGNQADAVIYLVGPVARASDRDFLEDLARMTRGQSKATNAVGVLTKVDLQPAVLERRHELARKIASQLQGELNTVVPVSAGLQRALDRLGRGGGLRQLEAMLLRIPKELIPVLLESDVLFRREEIPGCPVSPAERDALVDGLDWGVFRTLATALAHRELGLADKERQLAEIAGFAPLREVLERNLFARGHLLRCFRIVRDAREAVAGIKFTHLPGLRKQDRANAEQLSRFLGFVATARGDAETAHDLEQFLRRQLDVEGGQRLAALHAHLDRALAGLFHDLESHNEDFECLQKLQRSPEEMSPEESNELYPLLGLYGLAAAQRLRGRVDAEFVRERMRAWRQVEMGAHHGSLRRDVARQAVTRYGILLDELQRSSHGGGRAFLW